MVPGSDLLHDGGMPDLLALTNDEIRRRRLAQLMKVVDLAVIAEKAGVSAQNLDHFLKRRKQSTERADGSRPVVGMGDKVARQIEEAFGLGAGWLDWPFVAVDFKAWAALDQIQRAYVEGQLEAAIQNAAAKKAPAHVQDQQTPQDRQLLAQRVERRVERATKKSSSPASGKRRA